MNPADLLRPHDFLRIAYAANIAILVPVCWAMFAGRGVRAVFQGAVAEEPGLRLLVGSLWAAILLASAAGLVWPRVFAPVLLIQIVYKSLWLALFALPALRNPAVPTPTGITIIFALIVAIWPVLFWFGYLRA
ncbi:hypothetical protein [Sandarakinorhabdus oryzae]|uniref:hypothetical protein n=1 Tax=Sandarakinorhabdus oryzae TaxID=2675220 RepID=UPI0012E1E571|nr:hypothetical protein [Sandarakinorhabdus oryzae]